MQVKEILKNRIIAGEYPVGSLIPSEPELREEFDVSIITVRRAVEELALQGYVEKRSGVGTTVISNNPVSRLSKGKRFSEYLSDRGLRLRKRVIGVTSIDSKGHEVLEEAFPKGATCIERMYMIDEDPFIHFRHYISKDIVVPTKESDWSLYETMYNQGIQFERFKDEFGVETPEERIAKLLEIKVQPLLQRARFSYDINDRLIEYSIGFYNTNVHKYVVNFDL